jgi:chromosome segregation ATPase
MALSSNNKQAENYRYYVREYSTAKEQLDETQTRLGKMTMELELVSKELASTKNMLSETEALLAQAQEENKVLKGDPQAMANMQKLFGNQTVVAAKNIDTLKKQNEAYDNQLAKLKGDLTSFKSNVADIKQGRSLIDEMRVKIREVKERMRLLKKEAAVAREAAQKERDRQLILLGNNGYFIKDGEIVTADKGKKTVDIDVKFVP